jgi:hypothetical protein
MRQEAKVEAKGLPIDSLGSNRIAMAVLSLIVYVKVVPRIPKSESYIYKEEGSRVRRASEEVLRGEKSLIC